jgi:hypothetical protein
MYTAFGLETIVANFFCYFIYVESLCKPPFLPTSGRLWVIVTEAWA